MERLLIFVLLFTIVVGVFRAFIVFLVILIIFLIILIMSSLSRRWRSVERTLQVNPRILRDVLAPLSIRDRLRSNWRNTRGTLDMMKDQLLSLGHLVISAIRLVLLLANIHIHAEDSALKPVELLGLRNKGRI